METLNKTTMEETLSTPNRLLVGAGPGNLDPRVERALTLPLLSHLDPSFWEIMDSTADLLRQVFRTENEATLLLPATGMAGMETMFANLIEPGDKALIGHSGHFGALMVEVASRQGAEIAEIEGPEDGAIARTSSSRSWTPTTSRSRLPSTRKPLPEPSSRSRR